jgi:Domain of unknown function (DUF4157)
MQYSKTAHFDFAKIGIRPKLKISHPGDEYEQEADKAAEQVMKMSISDPFLAITHAKEQRIDRKCAACKLKNDEEEEKMVIRRKPLFSSDFASDQVTNQINNIRSSSCSPFDVSTKEFMESKLGHDFSKVKIHTDERAANSADSVNAMAYTIGNDIVFGKGQYQPNTLDGIRLLAHELAHVGQQRPLENIQRKDRPEVDRGTFIRENCVGVDEDDSKAQCVFTNHEERVIRIAKEYAVRKCGKAIFSLSVLSPEEVNYLSKLIFHQNAPSRQMIQITIENVRKKLERTAIVCKNCHDRKCNTGGVRAYVPDDHTLIGICPLFFNRQDITETPRYLIHEACHLAEVDIDNFFTRRNVEEYCHSGGEKQDYWNKPCPADVDNLKNADAWSFFIDRLSITG